MKDLALLISEFQDWALFDGKYSVSTIKRDSRKIRELSGDFNVLSPTQEEIRGISWSGDIQISWSRRRGSDGIC